MCPPLRIGGKRALKLGLDNRISFGRATAEAIAAKTAVEFKAWVMRRRQRLAGALGDHVGQTAARRCRVPTMGHRALQGGAALNHEIGLGAGLQPRVRGS
ncbi:MAG: hypothetical protein DMG69_00395 [Acidobacteria bacterium]|nr:MAG: hypothetical protein DMG69_00395 [Acidobacteriota bacterium]